MSDIYKACGLAIIAITVTSVLKNRSSEISKFVPQITAIVITVTAIGTLSPLILYIKGLINGSEVKLSTVSVIINASVIALVCRTVSDICRENGEIMLKNAVEFAGNAEIMLLSLPIIKELISMTLGMFKL